jgi:hypothetical protein
MLKLCMLEAEAEREHAAATGDSTAAAAPPPVLDSKEVRSAHCQSLTARPAPYHPLITCFLGGILGAHLRTGRGPGRRGYGRQSDQLRRGLGGQLV